MCAQKTPRLKLVALPSDWSTVRHFKGIPFGFGTRPSAVEFTIAAMMDITVEGIPVTCGAISIARHHGNVPTAIVADIATQDEHADEIREWLIDTAWKAAQIMGYRRLVGRRSSDQKTFQLRQHGEPRKALPEKSEKPNAWIDV